MNKATALPLLMSANVVARQCLMRPNVLANKNKTFQFGLLMPHTRWGLAACSLLLIRHIYVNWGGFLSSRSWPAPSLSWCLLFHCSINWEPADKRERNIRVVSMCTLFVSTKLPYQSTFRKSVDIWVLAWLVTGGVSFRLWLVPHPANPHRNISHLWHNLKIISDPHPCLESSITPGDILPGVCLCPAWHQRMVWPLCQPPETPALMLCLALNWDTVTMSGAEMCLNPGLPPPGLCDTVRRI